MLNLSVATRVYAVHGATDMRKSHNGLYAIVKNHLGQDPASGHLYLFCNRRRDRLKVLFWDGSGLWVCAKRLEQGTFKWFDGEGSSREISHSHMALLLGGIDLMHTRKRKWLKNS